MTNRINWDKDMIISEIEKLKSEGCPLNASYVMNNNSKLYGRQESTLIHGKMP